MKKKIGIIIGTLLIIIDFLFLIIIFSGTSNTLAPIEFLSFNFYLIPLSILFALSIFYNFRLNIRNALIIGIFACILTIFALMDFLNEPHIDTFLQEISIFLNLIYIFSILIAFFSIYFILFLFLVIINNPKEAASIKKKILDLSVKLTRVEVKEISERVKIDRNTIRRVMKKMVQNKEVYAKFYSTSKALVFNQKANIEEIDNLMEIYNSWEQKEIGKKMN